MAISAEQTRLDEIRANQVPWRKWGPYLSERQWGTVREDYSRDGNAWNYLSHDEARSRSYLWGEDGIAGLSDDKQALCFSVALWNGQDPILKERLFGLTNNEGNHGEDVKEYYFYLDNTPTHSYMKYLYKYPQRAYPYWDLVKTNRERSTDAMEYELLDTGIFDDDRYFDVFVEFAKNTPDDILIRIRAINRGTESAVLHVLPTVWFRNTWLRNESQPSLTGFREGGLLAIRASHGELGDYHLWCDTPSLLLFTNNETNTERLFGRPNATPYTKDAFHRYLVEGQADAVNPALTGTKAAIYRQQEVAPGGTFEFLLRLCPADASGSMKTRSTMELFGASAEIVLETRRREADEFYRSITPPGISADEALVMRQALSGMLWTKQFYEFDLSRWLQQRGDDALQGRCAGRNVDWYHMINQNVVSMPDKWEYPWYAAWDLAFHTIALGLVDLDFAKDQLELMLQSLYLHPNGQIPAYEWNFSDVNPPVHAWATLYLYNAEKATRGTGDIEFLKRAFNKLLLNFTWWVNRKDRDGRNVFEGGFLGLDNISVFDRSAPLPSGGYLEQADGTAWMALFCLNMAELSIELAAHDPSYEDFAVRFTEHFLWIATAINRKGEEGLWDEEDGFYYDLLRSPDGGAKRMKVRSMVGLLPLCAVAAVEKYQRDAVPKATEQLLWRVKKMPELVENIHPTGPKNWGVAERGILALINPEKLKRILSRMLDEEEFLGPHGIRSLSKFHREHPYVIQAGGREYRVDYLPAESNTRLFGGNSNWRGPVWFPVNALIVRALLSFYLYYGDNFKVECPTGSGKMMNLFEVSREISRRLTNIFVRDRDGRRPVYGGAEKFQKDPHWRDLILFYEYFHGDNGAGIGASHQTGWTGLVARLIHMNGCMDSRELLEAGKRQAYRYATATGAR
jgi:hypothetical protein